MNSTISNQATATGAQTAKQIVEEYLRVLMIPDPEAASRFIADDLSIVFTGGRSFTHPSECAKFNATRYAWVKKHFDQTDEVKQGDETIVYQSGTLYGEWPDGTAFDGNRYIDRYVVRNGLITSMEVWNDSAEHILALKGIEA